MYGGLREESRALLGVGIASILISNVRQDIVVVNPGYIPVSNTYIDQGSQEICS